MNVSLKRVYIVAKNRWMDVPLIYQNNDEFCYTDPMTYKIIVAKKADLIFGGVDFKALYAQKRELYYFAEKKLAEEYYALYRRNWKIWKYQDQIESWKKEIAGYEKKKRNCEEAAAELEKQIIAEKEALING